MKTLFNLYLLEAVDLINASRARLGYRNCASTRDLHLGTDSGARFVRTPAAWRVEITHPSNI